MAGNTILTPSIFAKMVLMDLGNELNTCRNMSPNISPEFGNRDFKVGNTVNVRKPYRFTVTKALAYAAQPIIDQATPVVVNQIAQIGFDWDSVEKTLNIREARELYARPAATALASTINSDAASYIARHTWNSVGTPGTVPTTEVAYLTAGDILIEQGLPAGEDLNLIVNRRFSSAFVSGVKTLFNPTGTISQQWNQGRIVDSLGYGVYRDQTIFSRTTGPGPFGAVLVNLLQSGTGGNNGTMTLNMKGFTAAAAPRLKEGDRFTIAGVFSVHPQTKASTGRLQQFVVRADVSSDASGNAAVSIAPAITPTTAYANVSAAAADGAAITFTGPVNTVSQQAILMHKQAFAFVSVPLHDPDPGMGALVERVTDPDTKISISMIRSFDPLARKEVNRFDVLYDFAPLYAEMCCIIEG